MSDHLPARITACADGPLLVRGTVEIVGDDGETLTNPRRTVALCRCGASAIKPWCDGTHKLTRFTTTEPSPALDA
jgi:CDGSH-type Zn-finger protein